MDILLKLSYDDNILIMNLKDGILIKTSLNTLFFIPSFYDFYIKKKNKIAFTLNKDISGLTIHNYNSQIIMVIAAQSIYVYTVDPSFNSNLINLDGTEKCIYTNLIGTYSSLIFINEYLYCLCQRNNVMLCLKYKINSLLQVEQMINWSIRFPIENEFVQDSTILRIICINSTSMCSKNAMVDHITISDLLFFKLFQFQKSLINCNVLLFLLSNGIIYFTVEDCDSDISQNLNILCNINEKIIQIFHFISNSQKKNSTSDFLLIIGISGHLFCINGEKLMAHRVAGPISSCSMFESFLIYSTPFEIIVLELSSTDANYFSVKKCYVKSLCNVISLNVFKQQDDRIDLLIMLKDGSLVSFFISYSELINKDNFEISKLSCSYKSFCTDIDLMQNNITNLKLNKQNLLNTLKQLSLFSNLKNEKLKMLKTNSDENIEYTTWILPDNSFKIQFTYVNDQYLDKNWKLLIILKSINVKSSSVSSSNSFQTSSSICTITFHLPPTFAPPILVSPLLIYSINLDLNNDSQFYKPLIINLKTFFIGIGNFLRFSDESVKQVYLSDNQLIEIIITIKNNESTVDILKGMMKSNLLLQLKSNELVLKDGLTLVTQDGILFQFSFEQCLLHIKTSSLSHMFLLHHNFMCFAKSNNIIYNLEYKNYPELPSDELLPEFEKIDVNMDKEMLLKKINYLLLKLCLHS